MEIDTAARHKAPVLIVVANNGAWAIEVRDQQETHGKVVGTAPAVRRPCGDGARLRPARRARRARRGAAGGDRPRLAALAQSRPALLDVLVTPEAVSSDAKSGLAWVPDLQPLGAWDDAERKWRGGLAA